MRFLDALLGRTRPVAANLDKLFGLPGAAVTLQASEGLVTTGEAAVCFKPAVGQGFTATEKELAELLAAGPSDATAAPGSTTTLRPETDTYGYRWVVVQDGATDELVTRAHFVNSTLQDHGYGPQLLCSVFGFHPDVAGGAPGAGAVVPAGRASTYLVYLYKRGTFFPFVPVGRDQRDNEAELRLKVLLADDLAIEPELDRWFPLWELPIA